MQNKDIDQDDQRLIEDLIGYYVEKKRLSNKRYRYVESVADNAHFKEAAKLCKSHELDAAAYVQLMFDRMGNKKEFFCPACLQGKKAEFFLKEKESEPEGLKIEITNATLDPADIWNYQHELAMLYVNKGESVESVLMDSSLKLFAWYRVLATPNRAPGIIKKYAPIARKEINNKILDFAKSRNLDIDRIYGAYE